MRTVTIKRGIKFAACLVPLKISVDGTEMGLLKSGSFFQFTVDEGEHQIVVYENAAAQTKSTIPAGYNNIDFIASIQRRFACDVIILQGPFQSSLNSVMMRNELEDYREGGIRCTFRIEPIEGMSRQMVDEWLVSATTGGIISEYLDLPNSPLQEYARSIGKPLKAVTLNFDICEGSVNIVYKGYSSSVCDASSEIISWPDSMTFDWLMSDKETKRTCLCATHNLVYIRDLVLSQVAKERPNAVLYGNTLRVAS